MPEAGGEAGAGAGVLDGGHFEDVEGAGQAAFEHLGQGFLHRPELGIRLQAGQPHLRRERDFVRRQRALDDARTLGIVLLDVERHRMPFRERQRRPDRTAVADADLQSQRIGRLQHRLAKYAHADVHPGRVDIRMQGGDRALAGITSAQEIVGAFLHRHRRRQEQFPGVQELPPEVPQCAGRRRQHAEADGHPGVAPAQLQPEGHLLIEG
jgi:hypothetical protein